MPVQQHDLLKTKLSEIRTEQRLLQERKDKLERMVRRFADALDHCLSLIPVNRLNN